MPSVSFDFTIVLEPQAEGGFTVTVPALPEVVTEGGTEAEAIAMAEDAIRLVLDYRRENGLPIPNDTTPTVRKITIAARAPGFPQSMRAKYWRRCSGLVSSSRVSPVATTC